MSQRVVKAPVTPAATDTRKERMRPTPELGNHVIFTDSLGADHHALVVATFDHVVHEGHPYHGKDVVNLVYVTGYAVTETATSIGRGDTPGSWRWPAW